ncbi:high affinity immunoglobulin epsilon receptor subunit alpha isoform X2 [Bos indicus]|uniref:high affinity immunoglobulin epsilon receptor subunit alpha isoform X2 n=1 Tax=Bos indicus TaxID=9915 RepID=UPI003974DC34
MPTIPMGAPALLWIALLLFSPDGMSAAIWKSKVSLNPPWRKILKGDAVTLICGTNGSSEDQSSLWIHNGTSFTTNNSRWHIVKARMQDSGEYQCRIKGFAISEPVYLNVISDWLIIQASAEVMMEGESLFLRCHSWKNLNVFKVIYYKDNKALKYCIPSKQLFLATISYPIVGGDSVCCGHRVAYLDPAAVHITTEDEENQETQQIYGPTA